MGISNDQKVDLLWKKVGYGRAKTDVNSIKNATNESIASPLFVRNENIWAQSDLIPNVMPGASSGVVAVYSTPLECTSDTTATSNRTWKTGLIDWIPPEVGSTYLVKIYIHTSGDSANVISSGTQIFGAGSGNDDQWYFDYQSGVLNFIGTNLPSGINGNSIYITGARYTGIKGTAIAGAGATFTTLDVTDLNVSGVSTFTGAVDANGNLDVDGLTDLDELNVSGISTFGSDVDINASVDISTNLTVDGLTDLDELNVAGISTFNDDVIFVGAYQTDSDLYWDTSLSRLKFEDEAQLIFGENNDLFIYHTNTGNALPDSWGQGTYMYAQNHNLNLQAASGKLIRISTSGTGASLALFDDADGNVELYYQGGSGNGKKLETTSGGIEITGIATVTSDVDIDGGLDVDGLTDLDELNVSGFSTFQSNVHLGDSVRAEFGDDADLTIIHLAGQNWIQSHTGNLIINQSADDSDIIFYADNGSGGGTEYIKMVGSTGEVVLYHYGSEKIKTTDAGAKITGIATVTSDVDIDGGLDVDGLSDLDELNVAGIATFASDLDINSDVNISGIATIQSDVYVGGALSVTGSSYFVGVVTFAAGADGSITIGDSAGDDITVGGEFVSSLIPSDDDSYDLGSSSKQWRNLYVNGLTDLDELNVAGLSTFASNVDVNASVDISTNLTVDGLTDLDELNVAGVSTFQDDIYLPDNKVLRIGNGGGGDLRIWHTGSNSIIQDGGQGSLLIQGSPTVKITDTSSNDSAVFNVSGSVELYHNNVKKFETTDAGAKITGIATVTSDVDIDGGLDVDGLTDLDELNVAGIATFASDLDINANLNVSGIITASSFDGDLNALGNTYYVATTGSDTNSGTNINEPYLTVAKALTVASSGDVVNVSAGEYAETCPLVVPAGVTVKGAGLRATTIKPTTATQTENIFHLDNLTTLEDFTIKDSYYDSTADTGYAFAYKPNITISSRSPYIQRVTVLNKGSVVTTDDPYGYDTADSPPTSYIAGRGALVDGRHVTADSLEAGMLFNEVTFFTPNNKGIVITNGGRVEYLNCFHYFASQGIVGVAGTVGIAGTADARLKFRSANVTPSVNDVVKLFEGGSQVAIGTITEWNSPYAKIDGKGSGTFTSVGVGTTQDVRFFQSDGTTQTGIASAIDFADYKMFGAEIRSVGCAVEYGVQGVVADGVGTELRLFGINFNHVGSGKDFTNDKTLTIQANETVELNDGQVSYVSIDQDGDFRVGEVFFVDQETGNVSFAATTYDLEVVGNMTITDNTNTTTITPTSLTVGNLQLSANTLSSTNGDIIIDPAGSNETTIQGNLEVTGILTASVFEASAIQQGDTSISLTDTGSNGTIKVFTDNVEAMRVDNSQNVGIGSTQPTAKLDVNGTVNVSGVSTFQDNVFLGNNDKLTFGDSGDELQIYHTGSLSYISDQGPGALRILGNQIRIRNAADNEELATFTQNGSVELYYDAVKKFETTDAGAIVTGILTATTFSGSGASLTNIPTSSLVGLATDSELLDGLDSTQFLRSDAADIKTSGNLTFNDNIQARFGTDAEMTILNDGTDNHITCAFDQDLNIELSPDGGTPKIYIRPTTTTQGITLGGGSGNPVELYHNNSKKFETTNGGVTITGIATATTFSGTLENDLTLGVSGTGLSGSATYNNSSATTFTVTSNATSANTAETIVARDASGDFSAGTITASLTGTATTATNLADGANITTGTISDDRLPDLITSNINIASGISSVATLDATSATIDNVVFGSGTAITSVDTDLSSVSNSDDTLASAKAIKTYVDDQITAQDLDFGGDSGTGSVDLDSQSLTVAGTANQIVTSGSGTTLTVALADNITLVGTGNTATISGPSTMVLDPAAAGNTGTVVIAGNLQVDGTTTEINSTTLTVDDLNITVASGAANSAAANGAGLTVDGANATFNYASTGDKWVANKDLQAESFIKNNGTSSQFLKADGSVDSNTYLTSESDTLDSVTGRGNTTTNNIQVGYVDISTLGRVASATVTTTSTNQTALVSLSGATIRSVEFLIEAKDGSKVHTSKILAVHNGTNVFFNEYATIYSDSELGTFDVQYNSGDYQLFTTSASTNSTVYKVIYTATKV